MDLLKRVGFYVVVFFVLAAGADKEARGAGIAGAVLLASYVMNRRLGEIRDAIRDRKQ